MMFVPQAAPGLRFERYRAEIDAAIARTLDRGRYVLGPAVEAFEAAFAEWLHAGYCVGVNSGTDAIALALRALGVGPGDEVIAPSLTAAGTALAILHCGAQPRFADVDPLTRCLDPRAFEAAITDRTAAVIPVHLFGYPSEMTAIMGIARDHGIAVVEDCAQAHGTCINGRKAGTFGHAAAFSFYPTKNLGAAGDGGAVVTNDAALAEEVRRLRAYGWEDDRRISASLGFNSRLDELQAAILRALLNHLDEGNCERRNIAARYREALRSGAVALPPDHPGAVYHQFAVEYDNRDALMRHLHDEAGIGTAVHYFPPLHEQPIFSRADRASLPETERLSRQLLSLPIQPEVAGRHFERIVAAVKEWSSR